MSHDYTRHAHRRTIWAELQRTLRDRFMGAGSSPPKEILTCEEVFFSDKEVTEEAILEVFEELQQREAEERLQMNDFHFTRRERNGNQGSTKAAAEGSEKGPGKVAGGKTSTKPTGGSAPAKTGG